MRRLREWAILAAACAKASLFGGCAFQYSKEPATLDRQALASTPLSYRTVESRVLGPRCLRCHNSGNPDGGVNLEGFDQVSKYLSRVEGAALRDRTMPPGQPLSEDDRLLLEAWISQGAPRDADALTGAGSPADLSQPPTWTSVRAVIFERHCLDCHSAPRPDAGLDLSAYAEVKARIPRIYERAVIARDMPLEPYAPLSRGEMRFLSDWIAEGMPE